MLVACSQSKEHRAEALIKENLKKSLFKPDTYKPVETKVDSAFAPYDDYTFFEELIKLGQLNHDYEELKKKAKHAKSSMAIFSDYQSPFGKNQYQEYKKEYEEAIDKIEKLDTKGRKQSEKVAAMLQGERKFIGYKAVHNYRADNNSGNTLIGNTIFFFDKEVSQVIYSLEVNEYNQIQEVITQFKEQLEETEE